MFFHLALVERNHADTSGFLSTSGVTQHHYKTLEMVNDNDLKR